jgi:S1-C subfamily serine protease
MTRCRVPRWCLRSWLVTCLVLAVWMGIPWTLAAALVTPEEMNSVRVYNQMVRSTVLIASAYVSAYHIVQASRKGLGAGVLIDEQDLIVADAHVLDEAANITVTLDDGTRLPAELNWGRIVPTPISNRLQN